MKPLLAILAAFLFGILVGLRANLTATVRMIMRQAEARCPEDVEAAAEKAEASVPDAAAPADEDKPREDSVGEAREPVKTATPEEIEMARVIVSANGDCMAYPLRGKCADCPFFEVECLDWSLETTAAAARAFLASCGVPVDPEATP